MLSIEIENENQDSQDTDNYYGVEIDTFTYILDCQILTKQEKFRTLIDLKGFIWNIKIVPGADLGL